MALKDLSGEKFGRLLVVSLASKAFVDASGKNHFVKWNCKCDCGTEVVVMGASLTRTTRPSRSCGCAKDEVNSARLTTHGLTGSFEYKLLMSIVDRCHNEKHPRYQDWGGRGIQVCLQWRNDPESFVKYVKEVLGSRPEGCSLDRIDNDKGYEPGNVRWATTLEQNRNQRSNRLITFDGKSMLLTDWALEIGVTKSTLHWRLKNHSLSEALTPVV